MRGWIESRSLADGKRFRGCVRVGGRDGRRLVTPWTPRRGEAVAALDALRRRAFSEVTGAPVPGAAPLVREAARELREFWVAGQDRVRTRRTLDGYLSALRAVEERWGFVRLDQLRPRDLVAWTAQMRAAGLATSTIRARLDRVAQLFEHATRMGQIPAPPFRVERPPLVLRDEPEAVPEADLEALLGRARNATYVTILLAADAGLRRAEIERLRWDEVVLEPRPEAPLGLIRVAVEGEARRTKSGHGRTVPILTDRLHAALVAAPRVGERVVPLSGSSLSDGVRRARSAAGLAPALQPLHGLRHRFGTWLADMGASPKAIRDLMGHRHLATTEGYLRRRGAPGAGDLVAKARATLVPPEGASEGALLETQVASGQ